jgi:glyoxylase-like metal-dependent hydrolase (beta-lactamase superfamily II)
MSINIDERITVLPVAPLGANCVFVSNDKLQVIIIDPGGDADEIVNYIDKESLTPTQILLTHGHFDHVGAVSELVTRFGITASVHAQDQATLSAAPASSSHFGFETGKVHVTDYLEDGRLIPFSDCEIRVLHTPGHSAGCVCFYIPQYAAVITGDTLFRESVGRTDFPGSSGKAIIHSIQTKLYTLPDETLVIPGHGETTTIGHEAEFNPYVRRQA